MVEAVVVTHADDHYFILVLASFVMLSKVQCSLLGNFCSRSAPLPKLPDVNDLPDS